MYYGAQTQSLIMAAAREARGLGHSYVGTVHLLLAMLKEPGFSGQLLRGAGLSAQMSWNMAAVLYGRGVPGLPLPQGFSASARRVLSGAAKEARALDSRQVEPVHVLLALLRASSTAAGELLYLNQIDT